MGLQRCCVKYINFKVIVIKILLFNTPLARLRDVVYVVYEHEKRKVHNALEKSQDLIEIVLYCPKMFQVLFAEPCVTSPRWSQFNIPNLTYLLPICILTAFFHLDWTTFHFNFSLLFSFCKQLVGRNWHRLRYKSIILKMECIYRKYKLKNWWLIIASIW